MANQKKPLGTGCGITMIAIAIFVAVALKFNSSGIIWLLVWGVVGAVIISRALGRKKYVAASQTAVNNYLQQFESSSSIPAGRYVTGHPAIEAPVSDVSAVISSGDLILYCIPGQNPGPKDVPSVRELGRIPLRDISDIKAEDRSSFESRVTATRVLALGVLSLAAKKKEKHESHYVTISWKDGKFTHDSIFEFDGPQSPKMSNAFRTFIVEAANKS